ncbi:MAG: DNA repair protein, partial [Lachnospiraceae bacterium]|nr:DNA repair protein [Lachnospiraceae bacterium]
MAENRSYICIDLKTFYASVECVDRGLDPMTTNLIVADAERSEKTICLAVSPAMKAQGVKNRCRVFEIPRHIQYITAPPRMKKYIEVSANIYEIYLKYISKDDIHVYSI